MPKIKKDICKNEIGRDYPMEIIDLGAKKVNEKLLT